MDKRTPCYVDLSRPVEIFLDISSWVASQLVENKHMICDLSTLGFHWKQMVLPTSQFTCRISSNLNTKKGSGVCKNAGQVLIGATHIDLTYVQRKPYLLSCMHLPGSADGLLCMRPCKGLKAGARRSSNYGEE